MSTPGKSPTRNPGSEETRLAWLVALVAVGLMLVSGALALDLHNQKRRLENLSVHLKETAALREAENKSLAARGRTEESALRRLGDAYADTQSELKKLNDVYTQREPTAKQAAELQDKIQAVANDLVDLAKTDQDARTIAGKYHIQQSSPQPGAKPAKP
jgi:chromosome segregation ATPase